jgi:hypothetical protein
VSSDGIQEVSHISRSSNEEPNAVANIRSQSLPIPIGVFWEEIVERSIQNIKNSNIKIVKKQPTIGSGAESVEEEVDGAPELDEFMMIEVTWMQPYLSYMINKQLPEDVVAARRIIWRSKAFVVIKGELYKKIIYGVSQRCVRPQEGQAILKDIHAQICGHHASSRAIIAKALRAYYSQRCKRI